jgi:hypothetical protein
MARAYAEPRPACSTEYTPLDGPERQGQGKAMTQEIPPDAMDRAYVLFTELIAGRWAQAQRELDARLRGQVGPDALARTWAKATSSVGSFEGMGAPSARQYGGYTVVTLPLTFSAGRALGEVVVDNAGQVAGVALEFPYPRPRHPEPGQRRGGFALRNPEVAALLRSVW